MALGGGSENKMECRNGAKGRIGMGGERGKQHKTNKEAETGVAFRRVLLLGRM